MDPFRILNLAINGYTDAPVSGSGMGVIESRGSTSTFFCNLLTSGKSRRIPKTPMEQAIAYHHRGSKIMRRLDHYRLMEGLVILSVIVVMSCFIITGFPSVASGQLSEKIPKGSGIEIGGGHNQFFWDSQVEGTYDRTAFSFMPAMRIHYVIPIVANMGIYSFLGYNEFGGRSGEEHYVQRGQVKVKDRIRIQNLETGLFGLYKISNFRLGVGAKVNRHLKVSDRHGNWRGVDIILIENSDMIRDWSYDGGIRAEYMSNTGITFGAEGWIGLSNLAIENEEDIPSYYPNHDWESMEIRQNHFRLLVGYRFN